MYLYYTIWTEIHTDSFPIKNDKELAMVASCQNR